MQLSQTVSMLLASIFLLSLNFADATPLFHRRSPGKIITLPVKRYNHDPPKDLHPVIVSEQIVNRALQRLARMSGGPDVPRELLERNLMRRVLQVEGPDGLEKRCNRRSLDDTVILNKRFNPASLAEPELGKNLAVGDDDGDVKALPVTKAKVPTASFSLGLDIEANDVSYLATVQIGSPPRDFSVIVDSGSADFWVGSENCTSTNGSGCGNHVFLGANSSSSFNDSGIPWNITYGKGSIQGTIVKDNLSIAGLNLPGHTFGVANIESEEFSDSKFPFDGLMGLAQSALANQGTDTPVDALGNLIEQRIVSYKMGRVSDGANNNDGEITFGGLNSAKFDSKTLVTVPNINRGFWEARMDDVTANGVSLGLPNRTAILDTGTTLMLIPVEDARAIHAKIPGSRFDNGFIIPCNTKTVVSLSFGGRAFDMNPRDLSFAPLRDGTCLSAIVGSNSGIVRDGQWLIGAAFLKNVYLSTDITANTISLAKLV